MIRKHILRHQESRASNRGPFQRRLRRCRQPSRATTPISSVRTYAVSSIGVTLWHLCGRRASIRAILTKHMITAQEIEEKARQFEIHTSSVQRDYVFGWLLFGIFTLSDLKEIIFLKGGNALRKGYFAETRYSNDLDFG